MSIPILSDLTHSISKDYGVYLEDNGHSLRGLFIIDGKGVLRQITMNDLPVGRCATFMYGKLAWVQNLSDKSA